MAKGGSGLSRPAGGGRRPGAVNTAFVLDMQRKLHRWSTAKADRVFADLFNIVCDRRTLDEAWRRLARNRGSQTPGTDGVTRKRVEERPGGAAGFLEDIREALRGGIYRPEPVRQRLIPKPGRPDKMRPLGIPTLKDRLVQMALKLVLEPIFEADFYPTSYGFRPGRSTHDALGAIQRRMHPTAHGPSLYRYVIEGDIKGCFDAIDHHVLMNRVRKRIGDRKILRIVRAFLTAGIMVEGTVRHPVTGTPQGGIISPLLANIYLTAIDERYGRWSLRPRERPQNAADRRHYDRQRGKPTFYMVRYADDFVVCADGTREEAEAEKQALAAFLKEELCMELSLEKTKITAVEEGFDFLGYNVVQTKARRTGRMVGNLFIPKSKLKDLRRKIKVKVRGMPTGRPLAYLLGSLNPIITGWRNYYRYATHATRDFNNLDWWMWGRVWRWLRKKHKGRKLHELRRRFTDPAKSNWRWAENGVSIRTFLEGGSFRYPYRGIRIPNGWNEPSEQFRKGNVHFWSSINTLARL